MRYFNFVLGIIFSLFPLVALSQIPEFQKLDIDGDGKITEEEYQQYDFGSVQEAENEPINEESAERKGLTEEENAKSLSDYIGIQKSFLSGDGAFFGRAESILGSVKADPGQFNYTFNPEGDLFTVDLAVLFRFLSINDELGDPEDKWIPALYALPVFEAHISSSDSGTNNSLQLQIPFIFSFSENIAAKVVNSQDSSEVPESSFISSHYLIGSPLYQTDREFKTSIIGFDVLYSPGIPSLGIGSPIREGKSRFRWRPLVGFEFGQVLDDGGNKKALPEETFIRATARIRAELLVIDKLTFSADYIWRLDLNGNNDLRDYIDLSLTYFLDQSENISIGLTYKNGENTPQFVDVDELSTFLGFKF